MAKSLRNINLRNICDSPEDKILFEIFVALLRIRFCLKGV